MKYALLFLVTLNLSTNWWDEAVIQKNEIDASAKLKHSRITKSARYETFLYEKFKKTTFCSNNFDVTDTISRARYMKNNFVFYVREWYVADYQDFGTNPKDFPEGEVYESIYIFRSKFNGILLQRSEPYYSKNQVDSLIKTLPKKEFDTLLINNITYNRVKGKHGEMVKLRFKRDK